jgi:hypothetical protein
MEPLEKLPLLELSITHNLSDTDSERTEPKIDQIALDTDRTKPNTDRFADMFTTEESGTFFRDLFVSCMSGLIPALYPIFWNPLTTRMDSLMTRMDSLTMRMDSLMTRMDSLTTRMDGMDYSLTPRMDGMDDSLKKRMDDMAQR